MTKRHSEVLLVFLGPLLLSCGAPVPMCGEFFERSVWQVEGQPETWNCNVISQFGPVYDVSGGRCQQTIENFVLRVSSGQSPEPDTVSGTTFATLGTHNAVFRYTDSNCAGTGRICYYRSAACPFEVTSAGALGSIVEGRLISPCVLMRGASEPGPLRVTVFQYSFRAKYEAIVLNGTQPSTMRCP